MRILRLWVYLCAAGACLSSMGCSKAFVRHSVVDQDYRHTVASIGVVASDDAELDQVFVSELNAEGIPAELIPPGRQERYILTLESGSRTTMRRVDASIFDSVLSLGGTQLLGYLVVVGTAAAIGDTATLDALTGKKVVDTTYMIVVGVLTDTEKGTEIWRGKFVDKGKRHGDERMKQYAEELARMFRKDEVFRRTG